jgi:hypothetical protein
MCDNCRTILGTCALPHNEKDCYLVSTAYCTTCSSYGHIYEDCRYKNDDVEFLEQLIPYMILKENGILTKTPYVKAKVHGEYPRISNTPEYIEELIPYSFIKQYRIASHTSIISSKIKRYELTPCPYKISVVDNPKAIRDLLKSMNHMPSKTDRNKDKYKNHLEKFANDNGYIVQYY